MQPMRPARLCQKLITKSSNMSGQLLPLLLIVTRQSLRQHLVPTLRPGEFVIMDNLPAHKVEGIREMIQAVGALLIYLPPYSPDLNPIEQLFAKLIGYSQSYGAWGYGAGGAGAGQAHRSGNFRARRARWR